MVSTLTGISFLMGFANRDGGSILKIPEGWRESFPRRGPCFLALNAEREPGCIRNWPPRTTCRMSRSWLLSPESNDFTRTAIKESHLPAVADAFAAGTAVKARSK